MKLTPVQKAWLKGAEVAVVSGIGSAALQELSAGGLPTTKAGWTKFASIIAGSVYTALKLYMAQNPLSECVP